MVNNERTGAASIPIFYQAGRSPQPNAIFEGRYLVKLAQTAAETESALRLRHDVFTVELGVPPEGQPAGNLEYDEYDAVSRHLIVVDRVSGRTVGTYRLNSIESAQAAEGFYSYHEFSIEDLPFEVLAQSLEIGRACIAREHRNSKVLFLLWKGLLEYLRFSRKRYFFGCCSVFTQNTAAGAKLYRQFERQKLLRTDLSVEPRPHRRFPLKESSDEDVPVELPALFNLYLKIGVKICGQPAIDRKFGTIDFFVLFDLEEMNGKYQKLFFRPAAQPVRKDYRPAAWS